MQRPSWAGGRSNSYGDLGIRRDPSYSKTRRPRQGFARGLLSQRGLRTNILLLVLAVGILLLLYRHGGLQRGKGAGSDQGAEFLSTVERLIQDTETARQQTVDDLQQAFARWKSFQSQAASAKERLRDAKADLDRLVELHDQRMNLHLSSGMDAATAAGNTKSETSADLKQAWDAELQTGKEAYNKAADAERAAAERETEAGATVHSLRDEVQAMGAALAEYREKQKSGAGGLRGTGQPGNRFDRKRLMETFKTPSGEQLMESEHDALDTTDLDTTDRHALAHSIGHPVHGTDERQLGSNIAAQKGALSGSETMSGGSGFEAHHQATTEQAAASNLKAAGFPPSVPVAADTVQTTGSGFEAVSTVAAGVKDAETGDKGKLAGSSQQGGDARVDVRSKSGASRAMLPDKQTEHVSQEQEGPQWLRSTATVLDTLLDDSLRCTKGGICTGKAACPSGGEGGGLGCVTHNTERQEIVREATRWAWDAYRKYAFGKDELLPLSQTSSTWFDLGLTLVDALDTLILLGLDDEYNEARRWVAHELRVDPDKAVNLFETTIRVVGGLLAAFHLSGGDSVMLHKAASLSLRLLPAFESPTGIPFSDVNLRTHSTEQPKWTQFSSLSEVTSLDLEYSFLARASGDDELAGKALEAVYKVLGMKGRVEGLAPIYVDPTSASLQGHLITMGARGDSYYEYLLKQWLLSGKQDERLLRGYEEAMRGVRSQMLMRTDKDGLLFVGELGNLGRIPKMDHLVCFLPGLLALGHHHGVNTAQEGEPDDLAVAEELMRTCYEMYLRTPTGLAPEIAFFRTKAASHGFPMGVDTEAGGGDFVIKVHDSHNLLRPETMESLFVLWRVTGKMDYQEWAWAIFRAFQQHTRVATGGYANLDTCLKVPAPQRDKMESFWLAETLKYLYLVLDDSQPQLVSLDEYIFNTEAHPLPIQGSLADISAGSAYITRPYGGHVNLTLDERIQFWEQAAQDAVADDKDVA